MDATRRQDGWLAALRPGAVAERAGLGLESWWKHRVEHEVRAALMPTGLVPEAHDDLDAAHRVRRRGPSSPPTMQSEATVSPAVAARGDAGRLLRRRHHRAVRLPPRPPDRGRLRALGRARGYPVVALENDGQPYPPNVIARLEVFAQNVERYEGRRPHGPSRVDG